MSVTLQDDAELFMASARFQSVASGLKKIIDGQKIEGTEAEHLSWTGDLTGRMDWISQQGSEHPELSVLATRLRPTYYSALLRVGVPYSDTFSQRLHETLQSGGRDNHLNTEELARAHLVYQEMATCILSYLQNSCQMGQI